MISTDADSSFDVIPTFRLALYAKLIYIPQSGELLSHTSHWRPDGIGALLLLDALLSIVSALGPLDDLALLPWGAKVALLMPAVEDAAGISEEPTGEQKEHANTLVGTFSETIRAVESHT